MPECKVQILHLFCTGVKSPGYKLLGFSRASPLVWLGFCWDLEMSLFWLIPVVADRTCSLTDRLPAHVLLSIPWQLAY